MNATPRVTRPLLTLACASLLAVGGSFGSPASGAAAAGGGLDPTFSTDGWRTIDFDCSIDAAVAVGVAAHGKLVVGGECWRATEIRPAVARLSSAGRLDRTFSDNGWVVPTLPGFRYVRAFDMALQPDGKVVVVGYATTTSSNRAVMSIIRFTATGRLDPAFSGDGMARVGFGAAGGEAWAVALQPDGRIVVAGRAGTDLAVARLLPDGRLDRSFSGDGKVALDLFLGRDFLKAVTVRPDGRILAAGVRDNEFLVVRFLPRGALDVSFNGTGGRQFDFEGSSGGDSAQDVAIRPDGRIVAVGYVGYQATSDDFAVARLTSGGALDPKFSGDGMTSVNLGGADFGEAVALEADGDLIVAGSVGVGPGLAGVIRLRPGGALDTSFGSAGVLATNLGGNAAFADDVAVQPDGRIVVVGSRDGPYRDALVFRLLP